MNRILQVVALLIGVLLTVFVFQNIAPVRVRFLGYTTDAFPLALVILGSALLGLILGYALSVRGRVRRTVQGRRQDRRIRELEAQPGAGRVTQGEPDETISDGNRQSQ